MDMCEQEFNEFKRIFIEIAEEEFGACTHFINNVDKAQSPNALKHVLFNFADEIADKLGFEYDTSEFDETIYYLELDNSNLETRLSELELGNDSIHDEMKMKLFKEHASKYTPWELEELLINGKR